jgi:hypothetical protein
MMTKRFVFNETAIRLAEGLKEDGFKFIKSSSRILRTHSLGFDVVILHIVDYWPNFQIDTFLGIRLNEVEDIVNKFIPNRNPAFMKFTETLGTSYMVLSGAKENYIEIKTEEELSNAINELITLVKNKGLKYFGDHRSIEVVNDLKKRQILTENNGANYVIGNLMQSLTLMKLCNDPDFEKLSMKYKELHAPFAGEEESGRKAMDDLIEYLKKIN